MKEILTSFSALSAFRKQVVAQEQVQAKAEVILPRLVVSVEPEEPEEKILPYIPFVCTHCGKPANKVTTSYIRGGLQLIPAGHSFCSSCFTRSKMISLQKIAARRFKVEPADIHPTNDQRRLQLLTSIAKNVR